MKSNLVYGLTVLLAVLAAGCNENNPVASNPSPATPQGVFSITGDRAVYVYFLGPYEADLDYFIVWRSNEAVSNYREIGRVPAESNPNLDLIRYEYVDHAVSNGATYYYAVTSVDRVGQESELSAEEVFDTPRPEGTVRLFPYEVEPTLSGFSFADSTRVRWNSAAADVYVDTFDGAFYLNVVDTLTDIQDVGYRDTLNRAFDDVSYAPADGWSSLGFVELIKGHTYVIWTRDDHYAKVRVKEMFSSGPVTFQWAYQTSKGNPELAPTLYPRQRPAHGAHYLRSNVDMNSSR